MTMQHDHPPAYQVVRCTFNNRICSMATDWTRDQVTSSRDADTAYRVRI